jgi:outer membrane immunogenic protein
MTQNSIKIAAGLCTAALSFSAPAFAQDSNSWTGLYLGLNAGGSWSNSSAHFSADAGNGAVVIPPGDIAAINGATFHNSNDFRFSGGIEGGYNYQMGNILLGVETDFDLLDVKQIKSLTFPSTALIQPPINVTITDRLTTDWMWTVRPRIGWAGGPWLIYFTGGLAYSSLKFTTSYNDTAGNAGSIEADRTKTGWTIGGGAAYQLTQNWSVKGEYLYADLGTARASVTLPNGYATLTSTAKPSVHIFRFGVDYKF